MKVFWILINFFFLYTDGQITSSNICMLSPPSNWKGMYTGHKNTTVTGKTCKMWSDSHHPPYGTVNYCRAPRIDPVSVIGPWCYIDEEPWWEYCFIPTCDEHCVTSDTDKNYRGKLNVTISGYGCRLWKLTSALPAGGNLPSFHDEDENYCRSPSGDTETKPWCYTDSTEKRWEHCAVPLCNTIRTTICPDLIGSDLFTEPSILTGHSYNTVVTFKCKVGYRIQGSPSLKCLANSQASIYGHWNTSQPTCIRTDCPVLRINNSNIQTTDLTKPLTVLQVKCHRGYKLQGDPNIHCDNDGRWSSIPSCIGVQCTSISITHSNVQKMDQQRYPDSIQVRCYSGYQINGSSTVRCTEAGQWSIIPTCVGVQCPSIYIANSNVTNMDLYRYPYSLQVTCSSGYQINGSSNIRCTETGKWDTLPTCDGVRCPFISINNSNVQNIDQKRFPDTIQVNCSSGYHITGNSTIRCNETGQWSTIPSCVGVVCDDPPDILNSISLHKQVYKYPATIPVTCKNGYDLETPQQLKCLPNKTWQEPRPECKGVICEVIPPIHHALNDSLNGTYRYPASTTIICEVGYTLDIQTSIQCLNNGSWNEPWPKCEEILSSSEKHAGPAAAIGAGVTLPVVVVVVVVVIVFVRQRRKNKHCKDKEKPYKDTHETDNNLYSVVRKPEVVVLEEIKKHHIAKSVRNDGATYNNETREDGGYYDFSEGLPMSKTAVLKEEFYNYVENGRGEDGLLETEFLKLKTGLQKSTTAALKPGNKIKNKYKNLYAYDETRVVLETSPECTSDYINSSYINGYGCLKQYIASQGPQDNTVNEFWRMVLQVDCGKIVMLTNVFEEAKQKCNHYWPESENESKTFDGIVVTLKKEDMYSDFTIRHLKLQKGKLHKNVIQFHFTAWPDKDVPKYSSSLVHFRHKVNSTGVSQKGPIIVHCSAGIGRTGTYIALDYVVTEAKETGYVDVFRCVETLRRQRVNMVQTAHQYVFLHDAVLEALMCPNSGIPSKDFPEVYKDLLTYDSKKEKCKLQAEYELLISMSRKHDEEVFEIGKSAVNKSKNRYSNIIPVGTEMPRLISAVDGHNDYINAVFLPGYKRSRAFAITQMPMETTIIDFWRLVNEYRISVVVMMNSEYDQKDRYWPQNKDEPAIFGPFKIEQKQLVKKKFYTMMELSLTTNHDQRRIHLFQQTFWNEDDTVPEKTEDFFSFIADVEEAHGRESSKNPLLVHCLNGCDKSGLYCVMATVIERLRIEQDVDIQHIIKQMRNRRPQIIPNYEHFEFLYKAVIEYLKQFETYANFN